MEVREGQITHTVLVPIPEVILRPEWLDFDFAEFNRRLLTGEYSRQVAIERDDRSNLIRWSSYYHLPEPPDAVLGEIAGQNVGSWRYWFERVEGEVNDHCHFDYPVQFIRPTISPTLTSNHPHFGKYDSVTAYEPNNGKAQYTLEDSKTTLRIQYFPLGLVAIRIRTYFRGSDSFFSEGSLSHLIHEVVPNLRVSEKEVAEAWSSKNGPHWDKIRDSVGVPKESPDDKSTLTSDSPRLFDILRTDILANLLSPDHDDFVSRVVGREELNSFPIVFLYDATRLNRHDIVALLTHEHRELSNDYVNSQIIDEIGRYMEDNILVSRSGIFAHTNAFDTMPVDRRRNRRLGLLNNLYTGADMGNFTGRGLQKYINMIRDIDDDAINESLVGDPVDIGTIKQLDDIVTLPEQFSGTQKHVYNLLKDEDSIREFRKRVSKTTSLVANHESKARQTLKNIPFPFGF